TAVSATAASGSPDAASLAGSMLGTTASLGRVALMASVTWDEMVDSASVDRPSPSGSWPPSSAARASVAACTTSSEAPSAPASSSRPSTKAVASRSEEHTSELQSRENLVCCLLLEKKKNKCILKKNCLYR